MSNAETIASNESCRITRTSDGFEFVTGYRHEVYDTERGELLSQWRDSQALLERLEDADHRLTEDFRSWLDGDRSE